MERVIRRSTIGFILPLLLLAAGCAQVEPLSKDDPLNTAPNSGRTIVEIGVRAVNDPVIVGLLVGRYPVPLAVHLQQVDSQGRLLQNAFDVDVCYGETFSSNNSCLKQRTQHQLLTVKEGRYAITAVVTYRPDRHLRTIYRIMNPTAFGLRPDGINYLGDINIYFLSDRKSRITISHNIDRAKQEALSYKNSHGKTMYVIDAEGG